MADGPFSRLYHVFADEFPAVYDDDHALASYVRLLMAADAAWPLRPYLPVIPKATLELLVEQLVTVERGRYTVMGLDKERTTRRDAARIGAAKRWQKQSHSDGTTNGPASAMPSRAEQSRAENNARQGAKPLESRAPSALDEPRR